MRVTAAAAVWTSGCTLAGTGVTLAAAPYRQATTWAVGVPYTPLRAPGSTPRRARLSWSCRTSSPTAPGPRSRYAGWAPWSTNTGRPETVSATVPSLRAAPFTGAIVTMLLPGFSVDVGSVTVRGDP